MKKLSIILTALFFVAVLEVNAQDKVTEGIQFENTTWSQILSKAKKENKLIFLDAYASWCGPCKHMAKNVFTNSEVAQFYNSNFVNAKIDMEKGEGIEIAKKYEIKNYPTFLFIDGDGKVMHQACGAKEPEAFISLGEMAFEDHITTSAYWKKIKNETKIEPEFMLECISVLHEACISTSSILHDYFLAFDEKVHISNENIALIIEFVSDYNNPGFQTLVKYQTQVVKNLASEAGEDVVAKRINDKIFDVYDYSLKKAARNNDKLEFDKIQRQVKASKLTAKDEILLKGDLHWAKYQKAWNEYVDVANRYVPQFAMNNYKELNSIVWTYYKNVENKEALNIASEWIQVSLSLKEEYSNQDTYAAILYKLGKKEEAANAANKAIELAQKEGIESEDTIKLLEKIEALN